MGETREIHATEEADTERMLGNEVSQCDSISACEKPQPANDLCGSFVKNKADIQGELAQADDAEDKSIQADMTRLFRVVVASMVGNVLEWYDFGVFAYFAPQIGQQFFPKSDQASSILYAFVVFGGGFFFRPLGGLVFGHIGDKRGRKSALFLSVVMMAASTFTMGCLPTYRDVGIVATLLLVLMRITQGFSVGGEMVGSMIYAVECAPERRQCLMGSLTLVGAILGLSLGSFVGLIIHSVLDPFSIAAWGWRIPFLSGILIGFFAIWIRVGLHESEDFEKSKVAQTDANAASVEMQTLESNPAHVSDGDAASVSKQMLADAGKKLHDLPKQLPLYKSMCEHPLEIFVMFIVSGCWATGVWVLTAFPPALYQDLMQPPLGYPRDGSRRGEGGAMFDKGHRDIWIMHSFLCLVPVFSIGFFGHVGDSVGNVRMMAIASLCIMLAAVPCLAAMGEGSFGMAVLGQGSMNVVMGLMGGNLPTWMVKSFPVDVRYTAIAVGYNAGQALCGGTASIIATIIYTNTRQTAIIGAYHAVLAFLSLGCVVVLERYRRRKVDSIEAARL